MEVAILLAVLAVCLCVVLPIVAIVRTARIRKLELRIAGVEAALLRLLEQKTMPAEPVAISPPPALAVTAPAEPPPAPPPPQPSPSVPDTVPSPRPSLSLETTIGQKWLGWVAVVLIFGAIAFFLKYAFENRWIGELGRVALGVIAGLGFAWGGLERHRKGWRYLSQVLTGGGATILYLSVYAAFGYYHLVGQPAAFAFLVIVVAEAHALAVVYNARAIAVMALVGGFLAPILLSTGRDQYTVLFTYIGILDLGMLGIVVAKRWRWVGSLAYAGTQLLFWGWYEEHYHPEKRAAVLLFQTVVFLLFLLADLSPHLRKTAAGWEEWIRLAVNPFVFYAICYSLLNNDHHDWMAVLALTLGIVYAALARAEIALRPSDRRMLMVTVGTALTFVTLAIPVQLEANWITIAWGMEAAVLIWASFEAGAPPLRLLAAAVFTLALFRFLLHDTPWSSRPTFTPVLNRYFLATLALALCFGAAAYFYRRDPRGAADGSGRLRLAISLVGVGILWLGSSVEAYTYFDAQAAVYDMSRTAGALSAAKELRWAGQLALSVLWSVFAGSMTAAGFRLRQRGWRGAGLVLFGVTLLKVVFFDISELEQFYRILAMLALGLVLLGVAWAYQRVVRREQVR
ncbi:MAG TPA: DUF2339 domain-containing protein [Bryobacteraceae bacterium]|nr:DUF2339 domain-containing protein [Bryobacteraceae bacterium]